MKKDVPSFMVSDKIRPRLRVTTAYTRPNTSAKGKFVNLLPVCHHLRSFGQKSLTCSLDLAAVHGKHYSGAPIKEALPYGVSY